MQPRGRAQLELTESPLASGFEPLKMESKASYTTVEDARAPAGDAIRWATAQTVLVSMLVGTELSAHRFQRVRVRRGKFAARSRNLRKALPVQKQVLEVHVGSQRSRPPGKRAASPGKVPRAVVSPLV